MDTEEMVDYLTSGSALERSIAKQYFHAAGGASSSQQQEVYESDSPIASTLPLVGGDDQEENEANKQQQEEEEEEQQRREYSAPAGTTKKRARPVSPTRAKRILASKSVIAEEESAPAAETGPLVTPRPNKSLAPVPLADDHVALARRRARAAAAYRRKNPHLFCVRKIARRRLAVARADMDLDNQAAQECTIKKVGKAVTKSLQGLALHVEELLMARIQALLVARSYSGGPNTISVSDVFDAMALLVPEGLYPAAEAYVKQTLEKLKETVSKDIRPS